MEDSPSSSDELARRCETAERRVAELERELQKVRRDTAAIVREARTDQLLARRLARIGTWTLDPEVGTPAWSEEIYEIYERDPNLGPYSLDDYSRIYSGADLDTFRSAISRAITEGVPYDIELKLTLPSGRIKWVQALCQPDPVAGPAGHCLRGTIQDVTERRRSDERLRQSELLYRSLAENFPSGALVLIGRDWTVVSANGTGLASAGLESAKLVGRSVQKLFPENWPTLKENLTRAFEEGPVQFETEYRRRWYSNAAMLIEGPVEADDKLVVVIQDVTDVKRAHAELEETATSLRNAVRAGNVGLWDWDLTTNTVHYSREWKRQIGYAPDEIGDEFCEWESRVHPDDLDATKAVVQKTVSGEQDEHEVAFRFRHRDGSYRWIFVHASLLRDEHGEPRRVLGSHIDITDRRAFEAKLRQQRALLANAERLAGLGAWIWRIDDGRLELSDNWLAIHGCRGRAPQHMDELLPVAHEDDRPRIRRALEAAAAGEDAYDIEHRIVRQDTGEVRHVRAIGEVNRNEAGDVVAVSGVALDITEQTRAQAELRESEERFRTLLDAVETVSVQGYSADGTVLYWNRGSEKIYGYSTEEAVGSNLLDLIIPEEMREDVEAAIAEMAATGEPTPSAELSLQRKDGSRVPVYSSHCVLSASRGPLQLYCVDVDLTQIRRAELERERLRQQLAQAQRLESVGRLAGGIAHDFNNMLGVILGNADLAASTSTLDDHTKSLVAEIRTAAERSSSLVAQLLAFARRQSFAREVLDVNASVGRMLGMLRRFIGEDVSLVWSPGADLERVRMDPAQLDQVLANLVLNARDAIDGTGRIAISTHPCDGRSVRPEVAWDSGVSLSVEDDGHGMDEKTRAQIFDPFFTTKEVGQGTGLGLATVYGIVTQNRGVLDVRSAPGGGTTFTLHLPAARATDEGDGRRRTQDPEDVPTGHERVLFVEDEVSVGNVVKSMLERLGYTVSSASSPRAALRIAEAQRDFDILVTDVVMPEMNGRELAERVCQAIPGIAVLFVSGFSAHALSEHDTSRNSVRFLQKPFRMHQLATAIRATLDGERLRSQDR